MGIKEIKTKGELAEVKRMSWWSLVGCGAGAIGITAGFLTYYIAGTESQSYGSGMREVMHDPRTMSAIAYWIIGSIVLIVGLMTGWYTRKKRKQILKGMER